MCNKNEQRSIVHIPIVLSIISGVTYLHSSGLHLFSRGISWLPDITRSDITHLYTKICGQILANLHIYY